MWALGLLAAMPIMMRSTFQTYINITLGDGDERTETQERGQTNNYGVCVTFVQVVSERVICNKQI